MNDHRSSSNNPDNLLLPVAIHIKSHQLLLIPVGMYVNSITYPLIISPTAILNSPINSFYPLDTALVLISDDFYSIFPPPFPSCTHFGGTLPNLSRGTIFTVCSHSFTLI